MFGFTSRCSICFPIAFALHLCSLSNLVTVCANPNVPPQTTLINRWKYHITQLIGDSEYALLFDNITANIYQLANMSIVGHDMLAQLENNITSTQMSYAMSKYSKIQSQFGGLSGFEAVLYQIMGVLENLVTAFYNQMIARVTKMKANPKNLALPDGGYNKVVDELYYMINVYMTNKTLVTYVGQVKANLSPANWSYLVEDFSDEVYLL